MRDLTNYLEGDHAIYKYFFKKQKEKSMKKYWKKFKRNLKKFVKKYF